MHPHPPVRASLWSRLSTFLLLLGVLGLALPGRGVRADEGPSGPAKPKGDDEKPAPPSGGGEGKDGEKKEGENDAGKKEGEEGKEEEEEEKKDDSAAAPAPPADVTAPIASQIPGPGGMVYVPGGKVMIGSSAEETLKVVHGRDPATKALIAFEMPKHEVDLVPYFADRYEVSNAQYLVFLKETAATSYSTTEGNLPNLVELVGSLLKMDKDAIQKDDVHWRQLYRTNKEALWKGMGSLVVKSRKVPGDESSEMVVDERATEEAFKRAPFSKGITLRFWTMRPPRDWPTAEPDPAQLKWPVTWVSYNECEAFAEWAGKHVLTEEEWEHAARGTELRKFPWGDRWFQDATHANWGGKVVGPNFQPRKSEVDDMAFVAGQSPFGCWHMLGNAAEWTSSWFAAYPGPPRTHPNAKTPGQPGYAKVIRGSSLSDQDSLVLRNAYRNFIGKGPEAPPVPVNRFEFVGFRCGWYVEPGRDQYFPIVRRATRGKAFGEDDLSFIGLAGAVATQFAMSDADAKDAAFVLGRAHAIVVVPRTSLVKAEDDSMKKFRKLEGILDVSADGDPVLLGAFHTDVGLANVFVRKVVAAAGSGGGRRRAPEETLEKGTCRPGTYLLAVLKRRLALLSPDLELVCYLAQEDADKKKQLKVETLKEPQEAKMEVDDATDVVNFHVLIPIGGKGTDEKLTLLVDAVLQTESGKLSAIGAWRTK